MNDSNTINKGFLPGLKEKRYLQKKAIIGFLYKMGELSKPEICRLTNVTTPTVGKMIDELMEEGWVVDRGCGNSIGGKRPHVFSLNPDAAYILGVDIGREYLRIAIFNLQNEPIEGILEYPSILEGQDDDVTLKYIKERIDEVIEKLGVDRAKIKMCGVALPGLIDREGNTYTYLTYERPGLKDILEEMLEMPVFIDNDSNVMAMAEHTFGIAKNINNVLCISVNECIGLGMILNSKLYRGGIGMAGEFGHIRISGLDAPCHCGKIGCLETVSSGRAIEKVAGRSLQAVIDAAGKDDISAIEVLHQAGEKLGEGIAAMIHLFNPDMVVIGGEVTEAGDLLIVPVRQAVNKYALARMRNHCELVMSNLGGYSAILGTLMIVMEHLYDDSESVYSLY
ncbi:ROK family transcriptional regulator [Butyricimonas hominis]|uniref:ROK family transcriptional regulator n=1 Tax=Butyricimonas TaxID=574697 RepID=UPI003512FDA9